MKDVMALLAADTRAGALGARVVSAVILIPPVLFAVHAGSPYFDALVVLGAGILAWEWGRLCGERPLAPTAIVLAAAVLLPLAAMAAGRPDWAVPGVAAGALVVFAAARTAAGRAGAAPAWLALGVLYIGAPTLALLWMRADPGMGRATILWLFAVVWAVDVGAYACGRLIGGPRLAPAISPNKTWAGLLGGVFSGAAVGAAVASVLGPAGPLVPALLSAAVGAAAQLGDLAESWLKRRFHVKDASGLIPGHGGLFDRVDGLLAAAAAVALIAVVGGKGIVSWT